MDKKLIISYELKELIIDDHGLAIAEKSRVIDSVSGEYTRDKGRILIDSIVKIDGRI